MKIKILYEYSHFKNVNIFILSIKDNINLVNYSLIPKKQIRDINLYDKTLDRHKRLISRAFLFEYCNDRYNVNDFSFEYTDIKRPKFHNSLIDFNISYSKDIIVVAIAHGNRRVGVDIEYINKSFDIESTASLFMHNDELDFFNDIILNNEKNNFYYNVWTQKEAYLKRTGQGLYQDPKQILTFEKWFKDFSNYFIYENYFISVNIADNSNIKCDFLKM